MKICVLEHPRIASVNRFNDIANTPLWSCLMGGYAASSLESQGFETFFLDQAHPGCTFEKLVDRIDLISPDLLAVNAVYLWEHTSALFDFLSALKQNGFQGHINLFGFFPTLVWPQILKTYPGVDSICVGEFEHTLTEIAAGIDRKEDLKSIPGLALQSNLDHQKIIFRKPVKTLDEFAFPKRSSFSGTVTLLGSRGCYNHCSFCPVPPFYNQGPLWRGRSPENITLEMRGLIDKGVQDFYFADPNFIGPGKKGKKRAIALLKQIRPLDIRFGMETRPQDLDDEIMTHLVDSGCNSLLMGIESGSKRILGAINKQSNPEAAGRAIDLCRKYGIEPEIGFLMFVPDSSMEDLRDNFHFLMKNGLLDRLDRTANLLSHCQIVLAGTSGYRYFDSLGRLEKNGLFGFEADVRFLDPEVEYISDLIVFACHRVLRQMAEKSSPIYWENPCAPVFSKVNQYLIDLFFSLTHDTRKEQTGRILEPTCRKKREADKEKILQAVDCLLALETTAV